MQVISLSFRNSLRRLLYDPHINCHRGSELIFDTFLLGHNNTLFISGLSFGRNGGVWVADRIKDVATLDNPSNSLLGLSYRADARRTVEANGDRKRVL